MAKKTKVSFESNIKRLEQIVAGLEEGDAELDKSLKLYEEGAKLIEACRRQLGEAETRIERIRPKGNGLETEPFEPQQ